MFGGLEQDFLAGIFRILAMAAQLHAERKDSLLNQFQQAVRALRITTAQKVDCFLNLWPHWSLS